VLRQRYSRTTAMMFVFSVVSALFSFAGKVSAAVACEPKVAQIVSIQGIVELRRAGQAIWQPAVMSMTLCPGDMLRVRARSRAALRLSNESMLRLDQKTTITFPELAEDRATSLVDLFTGALHILTRTPKPFKIRTPFVNAGVEGTEFFVSVDKDSTQLVIYEGQVSVSNDQGSLVLVDHEAAVARKNEAPKKIGVISPTDAVQWALYYPTIIDYQLDEKITAEPAFSELRASIELYQQGKLIKAISELDHVPKSARTAHFLSYYAGLLLSVGRVDEAKANIEQALELDSDNSDAYALKAIIAVVQNDKEQALNLATQAVDLDQLSPTAKLAFSYAQQAHFEIEEALASVQEAVKIDTQNALAWARLAELQMSTGDLDRALESARQAVNLNPALAKTQTVLGFAYLLQIDTKAAKAIFTQAITLDQTDPMPRLGLGLALIREGELEAGRIELEIAVSLDPANSLIRSYLGKAYFEEKRYPLASTQFDMAKERDPNDPTPWFYDAIQKQTQNRPVEALQDIEKSIELNNNRAVYRSRLLLDQDQAVRSASLARIYDDFGFDQRALMQASKSLTLDQTSHSSHRFLSDAYANMPRHEIARASELLQAQLLQSNNVNPVQPRLAATDLNIISGGGPSTAFNEFTPLFERNRTQLIASGVVGSNSTLGNETIFSGLHGRASFSLGQFHYETEGFRKNNDLLNNNYGAFLQFAVTPRFNVQTELRTRNIKHGDLLLDVDPRDPEHFNANKRREVEQDSARLGARYSLSPRQDLIASIMYTGRKERQVLPNPQPDGTNGPTNITKVKDSGYQAEVQHLFREDHFNVTTGANAYRVNVDGQNQTDFSPIPEFDESCPSFFDNATCFPPKPGFTRERHKGYIYANISFPRNLSTTLGFSFDSLKEGASNKLSNLNNYEVNKFNPKFGMQWDVTNNLRLRLAWFETVKSALVANQTLEPTQVAGFNQLFDDVNGTKTRRKGIGLDARVTDSVYGGLEVSARNLDVPLFGDLSDFTKVEKQQEELYRAYLYWLPHLNWAIRGEPQFEKFNRAKDLSGLPSRVTQIETLSAPLSIHYFNPSGVFAKLTGTYVLQDIERTDSLSLKAGSHDFFMLDTTIGYRLPNRRGLFSFEARNLLNQDFFYRSFNFQSNRPRISRYIPMRTFFVRLTLNF